MSGRLNFAKVVRSAKSQVWFELSNVGADTLERAYAMDGPALADLEWQGAQEQLKEFCHALGEEQIPKRVSRWRK